MNWVEGRVSHTSQNELDAQHGHWSGNPNGLGFSPSAI